MTALNPFWLIYKGRAAGAPRWRFHPATWTPKGAQEYGLSGAWPGSLTIDSAAESAFRGLGGYSQMTGLKILDFLG